jgi:hypothetical protein
LKPREGGWRQEDSLSLVNADQSFCGDVSDGRTRPAQLQDASNRQANDAEGKDELSRAQSPPPVQLGFTPANCSAGPNNHGQNTGDQK